MMSNYDQNAPKTKFCNPITMKKFNTSTKRAYIPKDIEKGGEGRNFTSQGARKGFFGAS